MRRDAAYRPDLDGLRAVAVAAVVLYHLELPGVGGGYVGVDVFFVLSGYLISRLIRRDVERGRFRLGEFYLRRTRRLFPALFVTVLGSFVVAALLQPAPRLADFAASALAALPSLSNFWFWSRSGYFAEDAITQPLLHTWSLGIEEQFYLFWPLLFLGLARLRRPGAAPAALAGLGVASFVLAELWLGHDPAAAFFLLPTRAGEFVIGALLVWAEALRRPAPWLRDAMAFVGLGLIANAVVFFDEWTRFPGLHALVPCLGAALVIATGGSLPARRLLERPLAVALGRISYSLYLVHWPLLVFHRSWTLEPFSPFERIALLGLSLGLATALHLGVEAPLRARRDERPRIGSTRFLQGAGLASVVLLGVLGHARWDDGWSWRHPASARAIGELHVADAERTSWKVIREVEGRAFGPTEQRVLLIGDSQAGDFVNILLESGRVEPRELSSIVVLAECGVVRVAPEARDAYFAANRRIQRERNTAERIDSCRRQWQGLFASERIAQATHVYVANLWFDYQLPHLEETARWLASRTRARIRFVGNKFLSKPPIDVLGACFRPRWLLESHCHSREAMNAWAARLLAPSEIELAGRMREALRGSGAGFVDMHEMICPGAVRCLLLDESGRPFFYDVFHTTRSANRELARALLERNLHVRRDEAASEAALKRPDSEEGARRAGDLTIRPKDDRARRARSRESAWIRRSTTATLPARTSRGRTPSA